MGVGDEPQRQGEPSEVELKFDLDPADLPTLRDRLCGRAGTEGRRRRLLSVYHDTPRQDLRARDLSLRLRLDGEARVQTVKAARGRHAGLFERSEWEVPVAGEGIDAAALADTPVGALPAKLKARLRPLFESDIDRTTWLLEAPAATVEAALDEGRVVADGRQAPFIELELELKRGAPAALFAFARTLDAVPSLRIGVRTKSERGYGLADRTADEPVKAGPLALDRAMDAGQAFQAVAHGCLRHFRLNEDALLGTRAPEALHQTRVAMRRLRSALSLFRTVVADERLEDLKRRLRDLSRELGEARNLDVYLERGAAPEAEKQEAEGAGALIEAIRRRREEAYDGLLAHLAAPETRRLILDLMEWVAAGPWLTTGDPLARAVRQQPVAAFAAAVLDARRRALRKKGRDLAALDPAARHRVRIAAKKLRYASEFFAGLAEGRKERQRQAAFVACLADLQGLLGDLNDIQTGHAIALDLGTHAAQGEARPEALFAAAHLSGERDAAVPGLLRKAQSAQVALVAARRFWSSWED